MNCDETFNVGICYVTDAYKRVCKFNEEIHADLEKYRAENMKLRGLVRDLYEMAYPECPSAFEAAFADRMRELGIEVDG